MNKNLLIIIIASAINLVLFLWFSASVFAGCFLVSMVALFLLVLLESVYSLRDRKELERINNNLMTDLKTLDSAYVELDNKIKDLQNVLNITQGTR